MRFTKGNIEGVIFETQSNFQYLVTGIDKNWVLLKILLPGDGTTTTSINNALESLNNGFWKVINDSTPKAVNDYAIY